MAKKHISLIEYILTFIGFIGMYFFIIPDSDIIFFSRDYENSVGSFITNSLNYGNGRFLGNFIGFALAHNFFFGFLYIAAVMTLIVILMNKFFFNGDYRTVLPVALLFAFPSSGIISEVYGGLPTFVNYVTPFIFVFAALNIIKRYTKDNYASVIPVFVFAFASCLFTENNTISFFILSIILVLNNYIENKKISSLHMSYLVGTVIGALVMFLIPKITGTSHNLDSYRGTAGSLSSMITLAIASFSTFTEIFTEYIAPIIIISATLIFLIIKNTENKSKLKNITIFYLVFFPVEAIFYDSFSSSAPASVYMYLLQTCFVVLYALSIFTAIICMKKTKFRKLMFGLFILVLSSVGPMMFANQYGYRTFYLPFVILLSISFLLLKEVFGKLSESTVKTINKEKIGKLVVCTSAAALICLSASIFIQSVYNYNFYTVRTNYIAAQIDNKSERINTPTLPCRGISAEDENPTLLDSMLYKTEIYDTESEAKTDTVIAITESIYCENKDEYYHILNSDPVSNTLTALKNLKYKDAVWIWELVK